MTHRTIVSLILLSLIFPAQEFWQVWRYDNRVVNWWISYNYPLSIQWYFLFLGKQVSEVLWSLVIYRITHKIQALRMGATVVLIYSLINLVMFFINFNRAPYALILSTLALVSLIVIAWRTIFKGIKSLLLKHHHA